MSDGMTEKRAIIQEIYNLLDRSDTSLTVLVRKAARLAHLTDDIQNEILFDMHLVGFDLDGFSTPVKPLTDEQKEKIDFKQLFTELAKDRGVKNDQIGGWPLEELERQIDRFDWLFEKAVERDEPIDFQDVIDSKALLQRVATRIRNRVARYVRYVDEQEYVDESAENQNDLGAGGKRVFLGHGRSLVWKDLKDFLQDRLGLEWEEFNREPQPGINTQERLSEMLDDSSFAFLIFTAEDEHSDGTFHPRENVIHEAGLFQGRLGFCKAIVLLEEGCQKFSNLNGLTEIRFPKGNILASTEEIRRVLEREGIIA
jgi:predicted nucleotide-binding protein